MNIRANLIYSAILTFSTYLVPLLVFPYISRALGAECIGAIDTIDGIIDYCVFFSMMGMSTLGIREVAKHKNSPQELSKVFSSLFTLNAISTGIVLLLLFAISLSFPDLRHRLTLLCLGCVKLVANLFWIEWFYRGLENFRYITLRSVLVRIAFVISVFMLVQSKSDYIRYYALFVGIVVVNALCNWIYRRKYIRLRLKDISLKTYIKPFVMLGLFAVLSAIYTKLTLPVLSFMCGDEEAGYYAVATRMYQVIIAFITSLISVLIPRMSVLVNEGKHDGIRSLYDNAFKILFLFGIPLVIFVEFFAPDIVSLFAGPGYDNAIIPMRIVITQLLVIGSEQIIILQLLIPMRKDTAVVKSGLTGVCIWLLLTPLLVPQFHAMGSAMVWVVSELAVLCCAAYRMKTILKIGYPWMQLLKSLFLSLPYILLACIVCITLQYPSLQISGAIISFSLYTILLWKRFIQPSLSQQGL